MNSLAGIDRGKNPGVYWVIIRMQPVILIIGSLKKLPGITGFHPKESQTINLLSR